MRGLVAILALVLTALSGCLSDGDAAVDSEAASGATKTEAPYHVDETVDLFPDGMDETWRWSMSPGMTGHVKLEYIPDPAAASDDSLCYKLSWPQGQKSRCASGGVVISVEGGNVNQPSTLLDVNLIPNTFTLRVWTGTAGPDTAEAHIVIDTFAAPED